MESTECSRSANTAASHTSQRDREGVQGTQHGITMVEPNGEVFGGRAAQERAAGPQISGMAEMRQDAQKSSTLPQEGGVGIELGWVDFTPANPKEELRRRMLPAVEPVKRNLGVNRIADAEYEADTRQWSPVPMGAFEANTNRCVNNGPLPSRAVIATDTSAFYGMFEDSDQTELRTGRVAAEVARSPQQQPTSQEALIGRLRQKASRGGGDALATLHMLESMHGAYGSVSPATNE